MVPFSHDTDRLVLRPFLAGDLDAVMDYYMEPDAQRYLDFRAHDRRDVALALEQLQSQHRLTRPGDSVSYALARKVDHRVVGQATLRWTDATAGQGELRFIVAPTFRNQGYGAEAAKAVISLGFDEFGLHRVFARCAGRDRASAHLMRKLGMRLEAHYREHALYGGEWDEELHFAVLDREWARDHRVTALPVLRQEPRLTA